MAPSRTRSASYPNVTRVAERPPKGGFSLSWVIYWFRRLRAAGGGRERHSPTYSVGMDYTAAADKFLAETDILDRMFESLDLANAINITLTLQQAKRVRNASTVLVRELARERDELQP